MTLQAFKEVAFESNSLRITPVVPKAITRWDELPLISYPFQDKDGTIEQVCYQVDLKDVGSRHRYNARNLHGLMGQIVTASKEHEVELQIERLAYWESVATEFLTQTMQNLLRKYHSANDEESRGDFSAAIHGRGHIYVPLPQGASLRIFPDVQAQMEMGPYPRWDCILKGDLVWFGKTLPWAVYHAHCQGFELREIMNLANQCREHLLKWFPWLEGHVCFTTAEVVSNPISHQGQEVRGRG